MEHITGEIPPRLFFRIGEVSKIVGVPPHVLRFWESEFPSVRPKKSSSRHRLFRRPDVEALLTIRRLLHEEKYTIAGARKRLEELKTKEGLLLEESPVQVAPRRRSLALVSQSSRDPLEVIREELEGFLRFLDEDEAQSPTLVKTSG